MNPTSRTVKAIWYVGIKAAGFGLPDAHSTPSFTSQSTDDTPASITASTAIRRYSSLESVSCLTV